LPYRFTSNPIGMEVLLVTSRDTKRWVLPKGNIVRGLSAPASAAHEAEEEAGILGAASPIAIGTYRYCKRRRNGTSSMVDVDVFPLAVTTELDEWEEQDERERRWFLLEDAAQAVDEPDLRDLIRHFQAK
jgi:8-oxo-dGTP pyrophosphatase MutT (NUDIX family)